MDQTLTNEHSAKNMIMIIKREFVKELHRKFIPEYNFYFNLSYIIMSST